MDTAEDALPNDVLRRIIQERNQAVSPSGKTKEKVALPSTRSSARDDARDENTVGPTSRDTDIVTDEDNLMKVMARRSHNVRISEEDLFLQNDNEASINFGAEEEDDDGLPGAYSGAPGMDYNRVAKTTLPQHMLGYSTAELHQQFNDSRLSATDRTLDDTDNPLDFKERPQGESTRPSSYYPEATPPPLQEKNCRCRKWIVALCILLVVLSVVLPTALLLGGTEGAGLEEEQNISDAEPAMEYTAVPNLTQYTLGALQDPHSPQYLAYEWVEHDPNWDTFPPWRKQQRFAMRCLYHEFGASAITLDVGSISWVYGEDECGIQNIHSSVACDDKGRIKYLDLTRNRKRKRLKGLVPPEVAFLPRLETIDFSQASIVVKLDSLLPLNVSNALPALKVLNLSGCELWGSIPYALGQLTTLVEVDLSQNELTSTIPSELGLLSNLTFLGLAENELSGSIPDELGELPLLAGFSVDNNTDIDQVLPEGFCREGHTVMDLLITSWCSSIRQCCSL